MLLNVKDQLFVISDDDYVDGQSGRFVQLVLLQRSSACLLTPHALKGASSLSSKYLLVVLLTHL